jgi:hypothetical protein
VPRKKAVLISGAPLANAAALGMMLAETRKYFSELRDRQPPLPSNVLLLAPCGLLVTEWEGDNGERIGRIQIFDPDDRIVVDKSWSLDGLSRIHEDALAGQVDLPPPWRLPIEEVVKPRRGRVFNVGVEKGLNAIDNVDADITPGSGNLGLDSPAVTSAALAAPITQSEGTAIILGNTYDVSVIFDLTGDNSFNSLSPTFTFTTAADALAAGDALKTQFGSSFDWNPFTTSTGGRIAFGATGSNYDFTSVCVTESGCSATAANDPLTRTAPNAFTFIQFSAVTAVPEPLTLSLFAAGVAGLASVRRRKEKRA